MPSLPSTPLFIRQQYHTRDGVRRILLVVFHLIKFILVFTVIAAALGTFRTWQTKHSANQKTFAAGAAPNPLPNGLYRGSVPGHAVSWIGKKFNATDSTGINVFDVAGTPTEKYPFKTFIGKGLYDIALDVLVIDYNIPANPFWLRPVLDEVAEITPGKYLGKLNLRIIPGYPFTLSYFELTK